MRNSKGISLITLIITIIVMVILAAIAFMAAGDQVESAKFSKFASEFGDYAVEFNTNEIAKVGEELAILGKMTNTAQKVYSAARDVEANEFDDILKGIVVPGGYTCIRFQTDIRDGAGAPKIISDVNTPVYEIKDNGKKFYGDANGKETHWVTAKGTVFTIPGYPRVVDGEERMYITSDLYYVATDGNMITANDLTIIEPQRVDADVATGNQIATDAADNVIPNAGGNTDEDNYGGNNSENTDEDINNNLNNNLADIKVGDYISYTPDTSASVHWRVWKVTGSEVIIIPTTPVGNLTLGSTDITEGLNDYNTAIAQIEDLCDDYKSSVLGITESNIRSLTIEDIEDTRVSELATLKLSYKGGDTQYNGIKTYTSGNYFGARYNESTGENEISSSFIAASAENPVKVKQTHYYITTPGWKTLSASSAETYGTILGSDKSWLASLCVFCNTSIANSNVFSISNDNVSAYSLFISNGNRGYGSRGVRPLISLSNSKLAINVTNPGDGSVSAPWNIIKVNN